MAGSCGVNSRQNFQEERQRLEKNQKAPEHPATGSVCPPININVLPSQSSQPLTIPTPASAEATPPRTVQIGSTEIPGLLEVAVEKYTDWQLSRVSTEIFKDNIKKARDITLANCLDLKQVYHDQDPDFFVREGVKIGVARRFVSEIIVWLEEYTQSNGCMD